MSIFLGIAGIILIGYSFLKNDKKLIVKFNFLSVLFLLLYAIIDFNLIFIILQLMLVIILGRQFLIDLKNG